MEGILQGSRRRVKVIEKTCKWIFLICALVSTLAVVLIATYMLTTGGPAIVEVGPLKFLFGTVWAPTAAEPQYGILPMILSSLCATGGAILIGVPIGLLGGVFLAKVAPKKIRGFCRTAVELLAGIPSVIYGFIGMLVVAPFVAKVFGLPIGSNLFTATIVLSIMILPTIITITETSINALPEEYMQASLALGATDTQSIFKVLIPAAKSGILTAVVLGVGRAIGETMAVIMVAGNVVNMPAIFQSVRLMTTGIVFEMSYATEFLRSVLFGIGLVLFVFIILLNIFLNVVIKKAGGKDA